MIHEGPLGRNCPARFDHVEKYALGAVETPKVQPPETLARLLRGGGDRDVLTDKV